MHPEFILKSWGVAKKAKQGCEILARKDKDKEKEEGRRRKEEGWEGGNGNSKKEGGIEV